MPQIIFWGLYIKKCSKILKFQNVEDFFVFFKDSTSVSQIDFWQGGEKSNNFLFEGAKSNC